MSAAIPAVQFAQSFKEVIDHWNMCANRWLKRYVYLRLSPEGTKVPLTTTLITYFVSAFWHGFYPGYYFCFLLGGVITDTARKIRRHLRPMFMQADDKPGPFKVVYDVLGWVVTIFVLNYCSVTFVLLTLDNSCAFWLQRLVFL